MLQAFLLALPFLASASKEPICTHGFTLIGNKCLKLFHEPLSHKNAERVCSTFGATLVTIKRGQEHLDVITLSGKDKNVWLGLYCINNHLSDCLWDDSNIPTDQRDGFQSGPNVTQGHCVTVNTTSEYWSSTDCSKELNLFVCELPTTFEDNCQHNYNGSCYIPHVAESFTRAQQTCEVECGNLVSIHSANENRYFNILASTFSPNEQVFIGGMWTVSARPYWIDGSHWDYNKIDSLSKREGACLVVSGEKSNERRPWGLWYTGNCDSYMKFFCKRPAGEECNSDRPEDPTPPVLYTCNSTILVTPGLIIAPLMPETDVDQGFCYYRIYTLGSSSIMLTFTQLDMNPNCHELKVYDGDSENSRLISSIKEYNNPKLSLISSGNTMFLELRTNRTYYDRFGFNARFTEFYFASPMNKLL